MQTDPVIAQCREILGSLPTPVLEALVNVAIDELDARDGDPELEIEEVEDDQAA